MRRIPMPIKSRSTRWPRASGWRFRSPRFLRPAWQPQPDDVWRDAANVEAAAGALGPEPKRVFLSLGRQELGAFANSPQHHYIARMIDPPDRYRAAAGYPLDVRSRAVRPASRDRASQAREDRCDGLQEFRRRGDLPQDRGDARAWHSRGDDRASAQSRADTRWRIRKARSAGSNSSSLIAPPPCSARGV